ncbi:hypothetical protein B0H11DRAFT_1740251 [Mycena galericulata]|nr:hypothetical protein B0H11DRAFT_1740251 [Mycena galericulata]
MHYSYSFLERVPHDVLQHIAFLGASPGSEPPRDLSCLLITSRTIYDGLNISAAPHLYAAIFKLKYKHHATSSVTHSSSELALELVQRCRALRRCRHLDMSIQGLRQDLWTLLCVLFEEGLCSPLSEAGFPTFTIELARYYLREDVRPSKDIKSLVIWLLCLGLTRQDILSQTPEVRSTLVALLRPFVVSTDAASRVPTFTSLLPPSFAGVLHSISPDSWHVVRVARVHMVPQDPEDEALVLLYNMRMLSTLPMPSDAAVILIFALKEAVPLQIPFHLPMSRAIAIAENRSGPTAEDYTAFQRSGTRLCSDIRASAGTADSDRSATATTLNFLELDPWISDIFRHIPAAVSENHRPIYIPGSLTGIWEGSLMISSCVSLELESPEPPIPAADFLCRTPMQCDFSEYFCFSPCVPLPSGMNGHAPLHESTVSQDTEARNAILFPVVIQYFAYQKFTPGKRFQREFSRPALDRVLVGQTLPDHEDAWAPGGFNFAGRVHDDGLVEFTRRPKNDESETSETWIFEGHLRYGTALVGTFRSSSVDDVCGIRGIFSMRKRE